ncbi:MAG: DUF1571 domain-containing protein [Planctomycetaceae bacterium]
MYSHATSVMGHSLKYFSRYLSGALLIALLSWSCGPALEAAEPGQVGQTNSALKKQQSGNSKTVTSRVQPVSNETAGVANSKLADMLKQLQKCQDAVNNLQDYTATFYKVEMVNNTGKVVQRMQLRHRPEPFSVHVQFLEGSPQADQVIYRQGWNQNQMRVKIAGAISFIKPTIDLNPQDPQALQNSRYPITKIGLKGMLDGVVDMWKQDLKYPDLEVQFYKNAKLNSNSQDTYYAFKTRHPRERDILRFQETTLWIDKQTLLPVQLVNRAFNPNGGEPILIEMYNYSNLQTNVGLQDADFDPGRYGW